MAKVAPRDSVILFSGQRDGAFVLNMRAREDRRDLSILRADKLLLKVAIKRELGLEQKQLSGGNISDAINGLGIYYVVAQPGFWDDLEIMRRFEAVLKSSQFTVVARFPLRANFPAPDKELFVYQNLGPVAQGPVLFDLDLPMINRKITASMGVREKASP